MISKTIDRSIYLVAHHYKERRIIHATAKKKRIFAHYWPMQLSNHDYFIGKCMHACIGLPVCYHDDEARF
jgi:hypothetical protein